MLTSCQEQNIDVPDCVPEIEKVIGIPFAIQHFKLAVIALAPVGKTVTPPAW